MYRVLLCCSSFLFPVHRFRIPGSPTAVVLPVPLGLLLSLTQRSYQCKGKKLLLEFYFLASKLLSIMLISLGLGPSVFRPKG